MIRLAALALALLVACGPGVKGGPSMNNKIGGEEPEKPTSPVVSASILAKEPAANKVEVKHILIGWKSVGRDGKPADKRAMDREKTDAETVVKTLVGQLSAKTADFDTLMKAHSEDPGSAKNATPYSIAYDDMNFDSDFRRLSIRLIVDEIGVVETQFGFHIIKRVQ
ncbi:MAG: peptidyl-prolyl cis-trans isomerase [Myxococcota bacterium]|nr:peptidylprolyl isomerase [Deltaproteobacteria bacterium]MDQ3337662.1 peptidyl-prolyl cis-trans isomerase [Myxococcota bacterium]